jgi:uncharacterized DUF497 family protein
MAGSNLPAPAASQAPADLSDWPTFPLSHPCHLVFPPGRNRLPMELDLIDVHFDLKSTKPRELEEALEDPFGLRLLPDRESGENRFYALGRTVADRHLFVCFWTDGKKTRVIAARPMSEGEQRFYERKYAEFK